MIHEQTFRQSHQHSAHSARTHSIHGDLCKGGTDCYGRFTGPEHPANKHTKPDKNTKQYSIQTTDSFCDMRVMGKTNRKKKELWLIFVKSFVSNKSSEKGE